MKVNDIKISGRPSAARIICDVISLGLAGVIWYMTINILRQAPEFDKTDELVLWIFPAFSAAIWAAYLVMSLTKIRFKKLVVTRKNAEAVGKNYLFMISICKLPLLLAAFDGMYTFHRLLYGESARVPVQIALYIVVMMFIIRLYLHRIKAAAAPEKTENRTTLRSRVDDD